MQEEAAKTSVRQHERPKTKAKIVAREESSPEASAICHDLEVLHVRLPLGLRSDQLNSFGAR